MKKVTYSILTSIPIVGSAVKHMVDPIFSSLGFEDGSYEAQQHIIEKYSKKHRDVQITRQLIERLISK